MDKRPYVIFVASQKGGVGKTTVALNLAVALIYLKYKVLLVDTDVESASLSEQIGIKSDGRGYVDVVTGKADVNEVMFAYEPIDLYIVPGSPAREKVAVDSEKLVKFYSTISKLDFNFIIIDSAPGAFESEVSKYINDVIILTTPDSVSSIGSSKMAQYCDKYRLEHRLVINRVGYSKYDLEREEIEKLYGDVAFQIVPEDKIVSESLSKHKPAYMIDKGSDFSVAVEELARAYSLKIGEATEDRDLGSERKTKSGLFEKMAKWFVGSK